MEIFIIITGKIGGNNLVLANVYGPNWDNDNFEDPNCRRAETVHVVGGFGPDAPQPPASRESVKSL